MTKHNAKFQTADFNFFCINTHATAVFLFMGYCERGGSSVTLFVRVRLRFVLYLLLWILRERAVRL